MQIVFDDGVHEYELDVRVNHPSATVSDLADALDPVAAGGRPLLVDGRRSDGDLDLAEAGLTEGATVRFGAPAGGPADTRPRDLADALAELVVVNGLDAGRRVGLFPGRTVVGRDPSCEATVWDSTVSRYHALVAVTPDGIITLADLGSHNGTWLGDTPVAAEPVEVGDGEVIRVGGLELVVRARDVRDRPVALGRRRAGTAGTVAFNRPPRAAVPPPPAPLAVPAPPRAGSAAAPLSIISILAPLAFAGLMFAVLRSAQFLLFAGLSPVMAIATAVDGKRRGRRSERGERERFRRELTALRADLTARVDGERSRRAAALPDPAEVARRVALPSTSLWERRPAHDDFLHLRLGVGDVPWEPPVERGSPSRQVEELTAALEEASTLRDVVVPVDLSAGGVVGIVGDRTSALAVARSLVCQATALHGPADLPLMVLAEPGAAADWDWAKWLPHTRGAGGADRMLSADHDLSTRMVEARLEAARPAREARSRATGAPVGPALLVVVDDETLVAGRRAPTRNLLRGDGGNVAGIVIAGSADRLPAMCTAVVDLQREPGEADLSLPQEGARVDGFLACGMADDVARRCARDLARYEDPELDVVGAGLPASIRLLPLLELDEPTPRAVRASWARAGAGPPELTAPIGVSEAGVFRLDLVADGPHGLVGGTTGAGKSELLRTIVAGLAATHDPEDLTFVLIDFKGGSAFDECARLPHTVGMVTDLDEHLAERALRCLEAELKYRERRLRAAGAPDLVAYRQGGRATEPLPRLMVIIDEFATLKAELPQFVDALVGVAQRGRSLGVHLLLATQRPQGAVSETIKANTNLRIALRVQDRTDSTDILDVADAAAIPRTAPGRAYVRLGHDEVVPIQTALSTGSRSDAPLRAIDLAQFAYGPTPRVPVAEPPAGPEGAAADPPGGGETDLSLLVAAIDKAFAESGRPRPRRPWPDPLPGDVELGELVVAGASALGPDGEGPGDAGPGGRRAFVPVALADDPDGQRQYVTGWAPADGNLLVYGIGGSGTTTALTSLTLAMAATHSPDDLHVYALDLGARELEALEPLPHVGAVVAAGERERQTRLIRTLRDEMARRRRLGAGAVALEPLVVTLVDGWSALAAEFADAAGAPVLDALARVFADGPGVRMVTIVSADRPNAVPMSLASLVRQRWALRLSDPTAYNAFGIRSSAVPAMVPGRALVGATGGVIQLGRPAGGVAATAAAIAARASAPARPPSNVEMLPGEVPLGRLDEARLGPRPWTVPLALAEETLTSVGLVAYPGEHALVVGPARSGKSTALLTVAAVCRRARPEMTVLAVAGPRSPLPGHPLVDETVAPATVGEALRARVDAVEGHVLLLVDDADAVDDVGDTLAGLSTLERADFLLVAAGRNDGLRSGYTHWTRRLRRSKLGVLLAPDVDQDADVLGAQVPRRAPVAMTVGRGYVVNGGRAELAQVALPD